MNFFRLAFELFALYILYKLIFDFIIPVAKTTKEVKRQFSDMSQQMQEKMNQQQAAQQQTNYSGTTSTAPKSQHDDYIDFEEVK
jgi:Sec-independent protein translocase protein TatA